MSNPEHQQSQETKKTNLFKALGTIVLAAAGVALFLGPHGLLGPGRGRSRE